MSARQLQTAFFCTILIAIQELSEAAFPPRLALSKAEVSTLKGLMNQKFYSLRELREILGITAQTLRNWDYTGKLKPHHTDANGYRFYSEAQLQQILNKNANHQKLVFGYCRVTENKPEELAKQVSQVEAYLLEQGYKFKIIQDQGSALDYKLPGLKELLNIICYEKTTKIVVLHKHCLLGLAFELIQDLAHLHNVTIEVINKDENLEQKALCEDFIEMAAAHCSKMPAESVSKLAALLQDLQALKCEGQGK